MEDNSLLQKLLERFPMCRTAICLRMMALQTLERYRNDDPRQCDPYELGVCIFERN